MTIENQRYEHILSSLNPLISGNKAIQSILRNEKRNHFRNLDIRYKTCISYLYKYSQSIHSQEEDSYISCV